MGRVGTQVKQNVVEGSRRALLVCETPSSAGGAQHAITVTNVFNLAEYLGWHKAVLLMGMLQGSEIPKPKVACHVCHSRSWLGGVPSSHVPGGERLSSEWVEDSHSIGT